LSFADLSMANLSGAYLAGASLEGCNFKGTRLNNAYLVDAEMSQCVLRNANLTGAIVLNSNLTGSNLREAVLISTDLRNANLNNAKMIGADFYNSDMGGADVSGGNFTKAKSLSQNQIDNTMHELNTPPILPFGMYPGGSFSPLEMEFEDSDPYPNVSDIMVNEKGSGFGQQKVKPSNDAQRLGDDSDVVVARGNSNKIELYDEHLRADSSLRVGGSLVASSKNPREFSRQKLEELLETLEGYYPFDLPPNERRNEQEIPLNNEAYELTLATVKYAISLQYSKSFAEQTKQALAKVRDLLIAIRDVLIAATIAAGLTPAFISKLDEAIDAISHYLFS